MSHLLGFLPFSSLPLACSVIWPSSLTLSLLLYYLLYYLLLFHDFHSHLMSPYFCWPAEHIKAPLTPHCPGKIKGWDRTFSSQSSTATRQYETLITEGSGLGNGLLKTYTDEDSAPGHPLNQACQQHHGLDECLTSIWHSAKTPTCTRAKFSYKRAE